MSSHITTIPDGTDPSQQLAIINKNFQELDAAQTTGIFYDANGVPSISIGVQPDRTTRIRVAKSGVNVTTATDDQLIFNSAQNVFKVVLKMTSTAFTLTSAGTTTSGLVVMPHNLGYTPFTVSNVSLTTDTAGGNTGIFPIPYFSLGAGGGTTNVYVIRSYVKVRSVDATNITYEVGTIGGPCTIAGTITTYVLQETAT